MTTGAKSAFGTTLTRGGSAIAELTNIGGIELSLETIDVTNHSSADNVREFIGSRIDAGEISIEGNFIPGDTNGQIGLKADLVARTLQAFVITFPSAVATTWTFSGLVTNFKAADAPIDDKLQFSATIKVSGLPVLGVTASAGLTTPFFAISNSAVVSPAASGSVYDYVATVLTGVTSVTITPTAAAGSITVNGSGVATGVASSAIVLGAAGSITTITVVVTETGKQPKTYTIRVVRGV